MKTYYKEDNLSIYNGDCVSVLDSLIEQGVKVDLTITSPPYDDIRNYNNTLNWNFNIFKQIANRLYEITNNGGIVVWIVGDRVVKGSETLTSFSQALYFKEIGFNVYDTMIYAKNNPIPMNHNRYEQCFEYMFILSKGKPNTFNGLLDTCKYSGINNSSGTFRNKSEDGTTQQSHNRKIGNKIVKTHKLKSNIWYYNIGNNQSTTDKIAFKHPAIFPEKLAQDHILSWSNENDIVLDCFMGSGTTGKMCKQLNRKFIGIDKVKEYCDIAIERIKKV